MDALVFVALVAVVAVVGLGLGLALAPRLTRWDERRSHTQGDEPVDRGGEDDHD
ncbi:MAG TPA: hypothetical protein VER83_04615 [Candidatus Nanopelagicales bacterium]|nr:hypothetical protein [Candidatus Nanopelagicales bacterium]